MIESFKKNGYLHVSSVVAKELLGKLQSFASQLEKESISAFLSGKQPKGVCTSNDTIGTRIMRCDDLFMYDFDLLNQLIASPKLLKLIKEICGPKAVVLQADLLYKQQHPHPVIKWHQGAPTTHESHFLNIGIYLDQANRDDGCVRYIPGTQYELQDIASIEKDYGWNPPGVVQVPTNPGDIIIQEMMVLHASGPKRSEQARRTIYIEVRPYDALLAEARHGNEWIDLRKHWMADILKFDTEQIFTKAEKAFYNEGNSYTKQELVEQLKTIHEPPIPSVYSIFKNEGPDYPIPEDLK